MALLFPCFHACDCQQTDAEAPGPASSQAEVSVADVTLAVDTCRPAIQVPHDDSDKGPASPEQHMQLEISSQATVSVSSPMHQRHTSSHANRSCAVSQQPTPIDVERSCAAEQVTAGSGLPLDYSSVSPPHSSQPALLPAGITSATAPQLSSDTVAPQSPSPHASMDALMPASSLQQATMAPSLRGESDSINVSHPKRPAAVTPHQLDFLMADDPVATAIAEANKVVADRAGLMSLADQRREALNLHVQAKDTYFAAAQAAHEKGKVLSLA